MNYGNHLYITTSKGEQIAIHGANWLEILRAKAQYKNAQIIWETTRFNNMGYYKEEAQNGLHN